MTVLELAQLVMDWSEVDDKVAEKGWDGGELEAEWDNAKTAMVSAAYEIVKNKGEDDD